LTGSSNISDVRHRFQVNQNSEMGRGDAAAAAAAAKQFSAQQHVSPAQVFRRLFFRRLV
jgi:hypothetical protein